MTSEHPERSEDARLAAHIARLAGEALMALRASHDGTTPLGAAGDAAAHALIVQALRRHRPNDAILSEEGARDAGRLSCERVWIVDPLDGTREYSEGRDDWAVHVALSDKGAVVAGAVSLPALGVVLDSASIARPVRAENCIVVSRSRPPAEAEVAARALGATLKPMGSAGAKTAAVLRGEAFAYIHAGGQYEWDSAAPAAVAAAADLHVSRLDGSPLEYNRADPYLPDLVICAHEDWRRLQPILAKTIG